MGYADAELSLAAAWYTANHLQSCGDSRLATSSAIEQGSCSWAKISYDDMQLGGGAQRGYAWGFNSGWQRELGGGFYAGASAGYGRTNFANRGISDAEGHRVSLGGILKYVNGNVFGAASLIGGYTWGDGTRSVRVPGGASQAESEHETWLLSARVRGGYNFDFGRGFSVTPSLDMNLPVIHDRGYREQGAGEFNMEVLSSTNLVPDLYPALQFGKQFRLGKASVRNWVEVGSRIRLNDLNSEVRLPDGFTPNTITHIGYRPDRSSTLWSAGLLLEWSERMELRVIYEEENGSSIRSRGGDLKLAWKF